MKKHIIFTISAVLVLLFITGCASKRSPLASLEITAAGTDGVVKFTPLESGFCSPAQDQTTALINSQAEFDAYVTDNSITLYSAVPQVDYSSKSLLGYIVPLCQPINFVFDSIKTDGTTTTVNATLVSRANCPGGILYSTGCVGTFVIADKITTPVVFDITYVQVDCAGNTGLPQWFVQ